nr:hypothetical protein [Angustibacter aerolatus]
MTLVDDIRTSLRDTTPVYAVVGATDLAVHRARLVREQARRIDLAAVPARLQQRLTTTAVQVPAVAVSRTLGAAGRAEEAYGEARRARPPPRAARAGPAGHPGPAHPGQHHAGPRSRRHQHGAQGRRRHGARRPRHPDARPHRRRDRRGRRPRVGDHPHGAHQVGREAHPHHRDEARGDRPHHREVGSHQRPHHGVHRDEGDEARGGEGRRLTACRAHR